MLFLVITLLQPPQPRISRVVIVGAVLVFIAGVSLLVYFYRRYKRIEKEPEEDWDLSRRSLFVNVPPPVQKTEDIVSKETTEAGELVPEIPAIHTGGTRDLASDMEFPPSSSSSTTAAPEPQVEAVPFQEPIQPVPKVEPSHEPRPTEVLASPPPEESATATAVEHDPTAFDQEVWAGLELDEQPAISQEEAATTASLQSTKEPPSVARVDDRPHREPFEPPRIERIVHREPYEPPSIERVVHREPYEPPSIEPLTPREQANATRELRSAPSPQIEGTSGDLAQKRSARETGIFGSVPQASSTAAPAEPPRVESGTRKLTAEPSIAGSYAHRAAAGSVLGLPAEPSRQPLILGDPARPAREAGIDALSNYGKDVGPKGSRAGTIALLVVVVLLGGGVLLYLFVPTVNSRVGAFVAHVRGSDTQAALEAAMKPRVQVIPGRLEVNKNMVTARGAVDNISDEAIENLSIEVSLQRGGNKPPETRSVSVVPNPLPPGTRGTFEFEYDGKRDTGFTGYTITKLFSNGTEVKFRAPGQK